MLQITYSNPISVVKMPEISNPKSFPLGRWNHCSWHASLSFVYSKFSVVSGNSNPLGEANSLQAIGDVLQFLDRRTEALERYEAALAFYREIGDRLGEANSLQAIGILQEDFNLGLEYSQAALELYTQIGTKYSQSRNLIYFTSEILLKLGRQKEAVDSLNRAIDLARNIPYQIFVEDALTKLREIQGGDIA